jgi:hypothetical protein
MKSKYLYIYRRGGVYFLGGGGIWFLDLGKMDGTSEKDLEGVVMGS